MRLFLPLLLCTALLSVGCDDTPPLPSPADGGTRSAPIEGAVPAVTIHPIVDETVMCTEHPDGQLDYLGDSLGKDCLVVKPDGGPDGRFPTFYSGDGTRNADWHGWKEPLLAPFDGRVVRVVVNGTTNVPGTRGSGAATTVVFQRADSTRVLYAHVREVSVAVGDSVTAGQPVGAVGNNGYSWMPHTHVGAWRGKTPLQVRFDLKAMGTLLTP